MEIVEYKRCLDQIPYGKRLPSALYVFRSEGQRKAGLRSIAGPDEREPQGTKKCRRKCKLALWDSFECSLAHEPVLETFRGPEVGSHTSLDSGLNCGCASITKSNAKAEIDAAFAERASLRAKYFPQAQGNKRALPNPKQYVAGIKNINVYGCPEDFQHVWNDYVIALERAHANDDKIDLGKPAKVAEGVLLFHAQPAAAITTLGDATRDGHQEGLERQLEDRWFALEPLALNYGVKVSLVEAVFA